VALVSPEAELLMASDVMAYEILVATSTMEEFTIEANIKLSFH